MKRSLALILALLLLLPSLAFGDVIVEPSNSFYRAHQKDCHRQTGRTYLVNGPNGVLNAYTAPNGTVAEKLPNGTAFYCQWTYTDQQGAVWGYSERHEAWFPLGYTLVQYDSIAFEEEHKAQIKAGTDRDPVEYETVYLYPYPGASDPYALDGVGLTAEKVYTDSEGRRWGFVSYIYGIRDRWFCMDDPANGELTGEKRAAVPSGFTAPEKLPTGSKTGVIAAVAGGVALVTLAAVLILFRKKRTPFRHDR